MAAAATAPAAAPAGGDDWKAKLALPPKDPRFRTEVRGLDRLRQGYETSGEAPGGPPQGGVSMGLWALAGPEQCCTAGNGRQIRIELEAIRQGSGTAAAAPNLPIRAAEAAGRAPFPPARPCPAVLWACWAVRPICLPQSFLRVLQDVTATKGNSFEDYFLKRCAVPALRRRLVVVPSAAASLGCCYYFLPHYFQHTVPHHCRCHCACRRCQPWVLPQLPAASAPLRRWYFSVLIWAAAAHAPGAASLRGTPLLPAPGQPSLVPWI